MKEKGYYTYRGTVINIIAMEPTFLEKRPVTQTDVSRELRLFLQLMYSLCKQYVSWYEVNIKK